MEFLVKLADYFKNDPPMLFAFLVICLLGYLLVNLQRCYNGLLERQTRTVALLQVLVFNKKNNDKDLEEDL